MAAANGVETVSVSGLTGQEINANEAVRALGRLAEDIHLARTHRSAAKIIRSILRRVQDVNNGKV
jgi:hypothetical protein